MCGPTFPCIFMSTHFKKLPSFDCLSYFLLIASGCSVFQAVTGCGFFILFGLAASPGKVYVFHLKTSN